MFEFLFFGGKTVYGRGIGAENQGSDVEPVSAASRNLVAERKQCENKTLNARLFRRQSKTEGQLNGSVIRAVSELASH